MKVLLMLLTLVLLSGCFSTGRYAQRQDSHPDRISRNIDFKDVKPAYEPYTPANLRPYTVLGKRYYPLKTGKGYSKEGVASWYGQKFHGHLTANGETYDMFSMSAAHKTLPLPSIVRVTNLANGKQAVVRVNDRGPFHGNRIIDLSYAAALKLDVLSTGTAKVKLDVMHMDEHGTLTVGNMPVVELLEEDGTQKALFIQVAALQDQNKINQLAHGLSTLYQIPTVTPNDGEVYRLRLGPLEDENKASVLLNELKLNGYENAYKLYATP